MPCGNCGGALTLIHESGGTRKGQFEEEYECAECGAHGYVCGDAGDPPMQWDRRGGAFE